METVTNDVNWGAIAVLIAICVIGIIGNLIVICLIFILKDYKKKVTHWYVLQLAIADSIFLLTLPFKADEDIHNTWRFTPGMCKAKETILFLNYYASILFLVVMSVDRYVAVCHGLSGVGRKLRSHFSAFIITGVVWGIALGLCVPIMLYSGVKGHECQCRYEFPKPPMTAEEFCKSENFSPEEAKTLCIPLYKNYTLAHDDVCNRKQTTANTTSFLPTVQEIQEEAKINQTDEEPFDFSVYDGFDDFGLGLLDLSVNASEFYNTIGSIDFSNLTTNGSGSIDLLFDGCHYFNDGPGFKAFLIFMFVGMFIVPFIIMAVSYYKIVAEVNKSRANVTAHNGSGVHSSQANNKSNRVTWMCVMLVTLFLVCWLPFHAMHMSKIRGITWAQHQCGIFTYIVTLIAYSNSALNPYLYNFFGTGFAQRIRKAKLRVKKQLTTSSTYLRHTHKKRTSDVPNLNRQKQRASIPAVIATENSNICDRRATIL